jgi:hypothetical protein
MAMAHRNVSSSNLASVGYDPASRTLEVAFLNGSLYSYSSVPESVYRGLMSAASHGSYFAANVKNTYSYRRVR